MASKKISSKKPVRSAAKPVARPAPKVASKTQAKVTPKAKAPAARRVTELEENDNGLTFDPSGPKLSAQGVAHYAWLSKPDEKYSDGKPLHKITVVFDPSDPEFDAMLAEIQAWMEQYFAFKEEDVPDAISFVRQKEDLFEGRPHIVFTTKAVEDADARDGYRPVPVFDPEGEPTTKMFVYSEDIVRVEYQLVGYPKSPKTPMGIKPYLNAVQIIEKTNSGPARGSTFKKTGAPKAGGSFKSNGKAKGRPVQDDEESEGDDIPF